MPPGSGWEDAGCAAGGTMQCPHSLAWLARCTVLTDTLTTRPIIVYAKRRRRYRAERAQTAFSGLRAAEPVYRSRSVAE